jgi:hypothetical protein
MNQENSSVLDLLRQAVEAAAGGGTSGQDRAAGLTSPAGASSIVSGLTGLVGGTVEKPAWTEWVTRVNPIAGLIAGLFAGRSEPAAAPAAATYLRPESLRLEAGFDGAKDPAITAVERQESGQFRPAAGANGGAQVVVQVQAMDSRSFLDHTPEIAEAVKRALLESNGLRDVLGEY